MLFGPIHYVRVSCAEIINHWLFDSFIMFVILSSTTVLAMDSPLHNPASSLSRAVAIIDSVCAVIFLTESCLKIVSFGLIFDLKLTSGQDGTSLIFLLLLFLLLNFALKTEVQISDRFVHCEPCVHFAPFE